MIEVDGSFGEGGGQVLRTSLALSLITRQPFRITRIRAGRPKPGLLRQHLTSVLAAAAVGDAIVDGAVRGSQDVSFAPRTLRGGSFAFDIGSAGSTMLVLQTILVPLLVAAEPSDVVLEGGTHNPSAPTFDFLQASFLPLLRKMGAHVSIALERPGFYPEGGGRVRVRIEPATLRPIEILERGAFIARRETSRRNVFAIEAEHEHVTEVATGFGDKARAQEEMSRYLASSAAVGEHLADQLLLPMAVAGGGAFTTVAPTLHTTTNAGVIRMFTDVDVQLTPDGDRYQCAITSGASSPTPRNTSSIVSPPSSSANDER